MYRLVDSFFLKNIPFQIESQEYDPNRSSFINLIFYKNGIYSYILSTHGTFIGKKYICTNKFIHDLENGNRCFIFNMPLGSLVNNISIHNKDNNKYIKAAGTFGVLINREESLIEIRLPSFRLKKKQKKNKLKSILRCTMFSYGTLGRVSNIYNNQIILGKAGRSFYLGRRPIVRGVVMNPVDHPHGGGEGKKSKKATPVNATGSIIKYSRRFKRKKN
jgi:large subunit ribosomal protein L2